jgi:acetoin utilization deacetylase AcuC-like enzyme
MNGMLVVAAELEGDEHNPGAGHPERLERLTAAVAGLKAVDPEATKWLPSRTASVSELVVAHDPGYLDGLMELCSAGGGQIDADTRVSAGSWDTACRTAGAGLAAMQALADGSASAGFVLGRPPGHHATRATAMGFCIVNNVAVTAATLAAQGERVAIFDWDVHHGNGTQDIFWNDPSVLYVSIHQWPLYPGTGRVGERGSGDGMGCTLNLPLPPGGTGDTYLALFDEVIGPHLQRFQPTWLLVSAGFDAHRYDPLGGMSLTSGDFADLTGRILQLGLPAGRLLFFLEGGYDPAAVQASVTACAARLIDSPFRPEPASSGGPGANRVAAYRSFFSEDGPAS